MIIPVLFHRPMLLAARCFDTLIDCLANVSASRPPRAEGGMWMSRGAHGDRSCLTVLANQLIQLDCCELSIRLTEAGSWSVARHATCRRTRSGSTGSGASGREIALFCKSHVGAVGPQAGWGTPAKKSASSRREMSTRVYLSGQVVTGSCACPLGLTLSFGQVFMWTVPLWT